MSAPNPWSKAAGGQLVGGNRLILWLFIALALGTTVGLALFALTKEGSQYQYLVWRALAGDLVIPAVAWFTIKGIHEPVRVRRWTWWILSIPVGIATYVVVLATVTFLAGAASKAFG